MENDGLPSIEELQQHQFESDFNHTALSGNETEKAVYRQMAQLWFNRGYVHALQTARARMAGTLDEIQRAAEHR